MAKHDTTIEIDCPVRVVYDQWTQFEQFPQFMEGVERVDQQGDTRLHWVAEIAGQRREWDALIVEQIPDRTVAWESIDGARNAGRVSFEPLTAERTMVKLELEFEPEGALEQVGDKLGLVGRRAASDLKHFREFIEARGRETGAWRGTVIDGETDTTNRGYPLTGAPGGISNQADRLLDE